MGIYKGVYVQVEEKVYHMEDYFNGENYLELKPRGKALMMTGATEHELTWKVDEGEITFTMQDTFRNIIHVSEEKKIFNDVDGNRFVIENVHALDRKSFRKIELYL